MTKQKTVKKKISQTKGSKNSQPKKTETRNRLNYQHNTGKNVVLNLWFRKEMYNQF